MRRRRSNRGGMSLIEAIAAITLLAVLAAMVLSSLSGMIRMQTRQVQRLGAGEIANRLMLQYLDDPGTMPAEGLPVAYDGVRYRWALAKGPARLTPAVTPPAEGGRRSGLSLDRLGTVTIRVWLSEESGGALQYGSPGVPNFTLTRVVDPTYVFRNPDSLDNMIKNPERMREFQQMFQSVEAGGFVNRRDGGASPGQPAGGAGGSGGKVDSGGAGKGGGKDGSRGGGSAAPARPGASPAKPARQSGGDARRDPVKQPGAGKRE